ncbi:unnamed protein product, partial [Owenia fusiformis]
APPVLRYTSTCELSRKNVPLAIYMKCPTHMMVQVDSAFIHAIDTVPCVTRNKQCTFDILIIANETCASKKVCRVETGPISKKNKGLCCRDLTCHSVTYHCVP